MQPSPMQEKVRAHVFVSGLVQGVGYRFNTVEQANQLSISGWVRNLTDERVEAVFEGTPAAVEQMIRWCHNGPRGAIVKNITIEYEVPEGIQEFQIKR